MFLGSRAAAAPYVVASKIFTGAYFVYFLTAIPFLAVFGDELLDKQTDESVEETPLSTLKPSPMYGAYS